MAVGMTGRMLADRYRTIRRLGAGGMATVLLAQDCTLGRNVAVKRLHADLSDDDLVRRFQREARLGASLNHPNVVAVYDIGTDDEGVLIVMEYVEGRTLRDEIAAGGAIPPERALEILRGVADALDHAHELGVLHRDVKPANVLLRKDGVVKLADLGIATAAEQSRITRSGSVLGTAAYMAPERLDGAPGERAADVYALAAVAFEALSGRKAVEGTTPLEVAQRVVNGPPPDLREALPAAPEAAAEVLKRALAKDPADRPATAGELVKELDEAFASAPAPAPTPTPTPTPEPVAAPAAKPVAARAAKPATQERGPAPPVRDGRGRPRWPILAALVLAATAALSVALATSGDDSTPNDAAKPAQTKANGKPSTSVPPENGTVDAGGATRAGGAASADAAGGSGPTDAVNSFYQHAARHEYQSAWAMLTERGQAQLGGYRSFAAGQSSLRSISFPTLRTTDSSAASATVELQSSARHVNRVDHVCGTVDLVRGSAGWLLDAFHLDTCTPSQLYPGGRKPGKYPKSPKPSKARGTPGAEGGD